jgi:tyrosyl-tRNA synthetase
MDLDDRYDLVCQVGEEIITDEDLRQLLETHDSFVAYDGFEPSGNPHIAQGIIRAININKMTKAGAKFKMLVADWHAWANNKMGGDLERIKTVGKYLIEIWKSTGMDLENVEVIGASCLIRDEDYWNKVMKVSISSTVKRVLRCSQIMGRSENEALQASQILYPCMQAADIFHLEADVCQLGMDQRKVNMLAREIGQKLGYWKPVVVSHHMIMGLGKPPGPETSAEERAMAMKMSKSRPDTAVFMTDTTEDIKRKLNKAFCPEKVVYENPVLEYCKYIIFESFDEFTIERPEKWGGNLTFTDYYDLESVFEKGEVHPADLKTGVATYIDKLITPVREHFEKDPTAKKLYEEVQSYEVTR